MNLHANARTTPLSRKLLVERVLREGRRVVEVAEAAGVCRATAYKWLHRYEAEGVAGLEDRSSAPHRIPHRTARRQVRRIEKLRRRWLTGAAIAGRLGMALSTVGGILRRLGLGSLKVLKPKEPVVRYERERPGELVHLDVKKLGRFRRPGHRVTGNRRGTSKGAGWDFVHVCVDDHSRVAYAEILKDERKESASGFLERAVRWFRRRGVQIERVMTACYVPFVNRRIKETVWSSNRATDPGSPSRVPNVPHPDRTRRSGGCQAVATRRLCASSQDNGRHVPLSGFPEPSVDSQAAAPASSFHR